MQHLEEKIAHIHEYSIFYRLRDGESTSSSCIVFLHGYPTSSLDYVGVMSSFPKAYKLIAHDQLGFGDSSKPLDNPYFLSEQADIVLDLLQHEGIRKFHLVAHDYGTSVATEIISRYNNRELDMVIDSVTLCNGSMLIHMSQLRLIQKLLKHKWIGKWVAKLTSEATFQRNMRNIWFNKQLYVKEEMKEHWDLLIKNGGRKVLPSITRYIDQRYTYYDRWIGGLKKAKIPMHILWAENDPVAVVQMAYRLDEIIQDSKLTIIPECGHYPMLEKEAVWSQHVYQFIREVETS